jgi:dTDP-4-amino-4,6-dideoxygalactose transaminase
MTEKLAIDGGKAIAGDLTHVMWPVVEPEERAAVMRVLDRGVVSGASAPEARAFEEEMAAFAGAKRCLLTHSGTSALQVAIAAADVGPGDEIIVPAYSFVATAMAPILQGAVPIFVDVDAETGTLDARLLDGALSERTRAIMPVHVHGCPADLDAIGAFAKEHGLLVIEDAAQAHGATYGGKKVGALFDGGGFSLQSSKNLGCGEGGAYVTNDDAQYELADRIRNFGQDVSPLAPGGFDGSHPLDGKKALVSSYVGGMYRGNEMMAAFARAELAKLPARTERLQANAKMLSDRLAKLPGVLPPTVPAGRTSVHHKFRVRLDLDAAGLSGVPVRPFRDVVVEALRGEGLEVVHWQSEPLPGHPLFAEKLAKGEGWLVRDVPTDRLAKNYRAELYPVTRSLLDGSFLLFSQSFPLIGQTEATVARYADAFEKVWAERQSLARRAR